MLQTMRTQQTKNDKNLEHESAKLALFLDLIEYNQVFLKKHLELLCCVESFFRKSIARLNKRCYIINRCPNRLSHKKTFLKK